MTTRRTFRRSRGRTQSRRKVSWENLAFDLTLLASGAIVVADLTPEPIQTITGDVGTATLMRGLLHFDIASNSDASVQETAAFGFYILSHEGFDQTAFSDPNADFFQDWWYWTSRALRLQSLSDNQAGMSWDADIRSKRRLRGGYKFAMVAAGNALNNNTILAHVSMRLLWALP